jgi:hypothetical protein
MVKDSSITDYAKAFNLRLNVGMRSGQLRMVNGQWPWTSGPVCFKITDWD